MIPQAAHRPLEPPDPLPDQIAEPGHGLLPHHRLLAVANLVAREVKPQGQIDVFGQGLVIPAAHLLQDVPAEQQAVARK